MRDKINVSEEKLSQQIAERRRFIKAATLTGVSVPVLGSLLAGCNDGNNTSTAEVSGETTENTKQEYDFEITSEPYKVALVGARASDSFDLQEGISSMINLMDRAKSEGASLIAFGELWLPGYDKGLNADPDWMNTGWPNYVANSITVGDANWATILDAAASIGIYLSFGFSELSDDGRYAYMAQALIADDGQVIYKRRKIRPSGSERAYFSDDVMSENLKVSGTRLGRISMLECWEHLRPQSTFNIMAQKPHLHICAWPYSEETTETTQFWEREEIANSAAAYFSILTSSIVLMPCEGMPAVYVNSVKQAGFTNNNESDLLFYEINPGANWDVNDSGDTQGEFSYGVLQLLAENYPGDKVDDDEHGKLNLVPL